VKRNIAGANLLAPALKLQGRSSLPTP